MDPYSERDREYESIACIRLGTEICFYAIAKYYRFFFFFFFTPFSFLMDERFNFIILLERTIVLLIAAKPLVAACCPPVITLLRNQLSPPPPALCPAETPKSQVDGCRRLPPGEKFRMRSSSGAFSNLIGRPPSSSISTRSCLCAALHSFDPTATLTQQQSGICQTAQSGPKKMAASSRVFFECTGFDDVLVIFRVFNREIH